MRKLIALIAFIGLTSFSTQEEKLISVPLPVEEWQLIYDALGELPAKKVEALRFKIYSTVTKSLADTVKKK